MYLLIMAAARSNFDSRRMGLYCRCLVTQSFAWDHHLILVTSLLLFLCRLFLASVTLWKAPRLVAHIPPCLLLSIGVCLGCVTIGICLYFETVTGFSASNHPGQERTSAYIHRYFRYLICQEKNLILQHPLKFFIKSRVRLLILRWVFAFRF